VSGCRDNQRGRLLGMDGYQVNPSSVRLSLHVNIQNALEKVGFVMSLSDIDLLLWGLLKSRKNRGISLPKYILPTLVQLPLISIGGPVISADNPPIDMESLADYRVRFSACRF